MPLLWNVSSAMFSGRWPSAGKPERAKQSPPHWHLAGCADRLTHTTWADDMVLVSGEAQRMAADVSRAIGKEGLRIATGRLNFWSSARPDRIRVQGTIMHAQDNLTVLGMSVAMGGAPDCAWAPFHKHSLPKP